MRDNAPDALSANGFRATRTAAETLSSIDDAHAGRRACLRTASASQTESSADKACDVSELLASFAALGRDCSPGATALA